MILSRISRSSSLTNFLTSAAVTTVVAGPLGRWLRENGSLDIPNHRSSHTAPVPRGGGLAALVGTAAAAAISGARPSAGVALSVTALAALGWADDVTGHVPARIRLAAQAGVGAIGLSRSRSDRATASVVTTGVVNVVNFMDGIDGISGLTGLVWGINAMLLHDETPGDLTSLGALTAGASLGFLPHNTPNATMFLGDVGSYALGSAMAAGILSQRSLKNRYRAASPLLLYGVDAAQALVKRARNQEPLTQAHRDHIYQQLVDDAALSHLSVATLHACLAAASALAAQLPAGLRELITVGVAVSYLVSPRTLSSPMPLNPTGRLL